MKVDPAKWLRANEEKIVLEWVRAVRRLGSERDRQFSTQELKHHVFLNLFDAFVTAAGTGDYNDLDTIIEELVQARVRQDYNLGEILLIPTQLKRTIWSHLTKTTPARTALAYIQALDPLFDHSVAVLVRTFAQATEAILSARVTEAEFMARRIAEINEEMDRTLLRLQTLYNVSRTLSSTLDINKILDLIAGHLVQVGRIDRCAVWLVDKERGELTVAIVRGEDEEALQGVRIALDEQASIVSRAFQTREFQVADVLGEHIFPGDPLASLFSMRAVLAVPLISEGQAIGVITVDGLASTRPFDSSTINLVRSVSEQAAIALRNAQLYDEVSRFSQELERRVQERTEELEKATRELEKLDRAKSDFISIAAHELKTPLTLIQGYTNILREDPLILREPRLKELLQGILKGAERLKSIIDDMIDVSLIDTQVLTLRVGPVSLEGILRMVVTELREQAKDRKVDLIIERGRPLPTIIADAQRLYQVFYNIIGNGIKYTPDGGRVTISTHLIEGENGDNNRYVEVVITDTGIGIDPEDQEHIFDKFYQTGDVSLHSSGKTKFKGGGPGLGLAIARGIVEAHGGRIWVKSEGRDEIRCPGSSFYVLLPLRARTDSRRVHVEHPFTRA